MSVLPFILETNRQRLSCVICEVRMIVYVKIIIAWNVTSCTHRWLPLCWRTLLLSS